MSSEIMEDDDYDQLSSSPSIHEEEIDFQYVYALRTFVATEQGQANAFKGDAMILLNDTNSYWWLVRIVKDSSVGFLPAEHIETPWERLARLNKHRNGELCMSNPMDSRAPKGGGGGLAKMFGNRRKEGSNGGVKRTGSSSSNSGKDAGKSVSFTTQSIYVSASEYEYSDDEGEDGVPILKEDEVEEGEEGDDGENGDGDGEEGEKEDKSKAKLNENIHHIQIGIESDEDDHDHDAPEVRYNGIVIDNVDRGMNHKSQAIAQQVEDERDHERMGLNKHRERYNQPERSSLERHSSEHIQQQASERESTEQRPSFEYHDTHKPLLIQKTRGRSDSHSSDNSSSSTTSPATGLRSFMNRLRASSNNSIVGEDLGAAILSSNTNNPFRQLPNISESSALTTDNSSPGRKSLDTVSPVSPLDSPPSDRAVRRRSLITAKSSIEQLSLRKKTNMPTTKKGSISSVASNSSSVSSLQSPTSSTQSLSSTAATAATATTATTSGKNAFGRLFKRKSKQNLNEKELQQQKIDQIARENEREQQEQRFNQVQQQIQQSHETPLYQKSPLQDIPPIADHNNGKPNTNSAPSPFISPIPVPQPFYNSPLVEAVTPTSSDSSSTRQMTVSAASYNSSVTSRESLDDPSTGMTIQSPIFEYPDTMQYSNQPTYTDAGIRTSFLQHKPTPPPTTTAGGPFAMHRNPVQPPYTRPQMRNVSAASAMSVASVSSIQSESHFHVRPQTNQRPAGSTSSDPHNIHFAIPTQRKNNRSSQILAAAEVEGIFKQSSTPNTQLEKLNSLTNPFVISDSEDDITTKSSITTAIPLSIPPSHPEDAGYDSDVLIVGSRQTPNASPSPTPSQQPPPLLTTREDDEEESPGSDSIETPTGETTYKHHTDRKIRSTDPLLFKSKPLPQPPIQVPLHPPSPPNEHTNISKLSEPSIAPLRMSKSSQHTPQHPTQTVTSQLSQSLHPDIVPIYQETSDRLGRLSSVSLTDFPLFASGGWALPGPVARFARLTYSAETRCSLTRLCLIFDDS